MTTELEMSAQVLWDLVLSAQNNIYAQRYARLEVYRESMRVWAARPVWRKVWHWMSRRPGPSEPEFILLNEEAVLIRLQKKVLKHKLDEEEPRLFAVNPRDLSVACRLFQEPKEPEDG